MGIEKPRYLRCEVFGSLSLMAQCYVHMPSHMLALRPHYLEKCIILLPRIILGTADVTPHFLSATERGLFELFGIGTRLSLSRQAAIWFIQAYCVLEN
jgi:hypothetical protein